jgi:hypothetical protein
VSCGSARTSTGTPTAGRARSRSSSSRRRARCSVRNVRQSAPLALPSWAQTCQFTCSSGRRLRPARRRAIPSRARAIHGVSFHATRAHSGPVPEAASTLSHTFAHPGPTLASRTTASTRSGARLAADMATPPPNECPTSTARSIPLASRSSMTARALAANPPAGRGLEPYPSRSAATEWSCAGSRSAT